MQSIVQPLVRALKAVPLHMTIVAASLAAVGASLLTEVRAAEVGRDKPTVVLVHGAFADSSSWDAVTARLLDKGYAVVAVANPLRSVKGDADYLANQLDSIKGDVILVGHSYGGSVISVAATGKSQVKALVYVAAFIPEPGESVTTLSGLYPGSTLGSALSTPVSLQDGNKELYIQQDKFRAQFAADVSPREARLMAAAQRPITAAALNEPASASAWKTIPSWSLYGSLDKNIPAVAQDFMAKRAGAKTVEIKGASHVVMISHPQALVRMVDDAAAAVAQ